MKGLKIRVAGRACTRNIVKSLGATPVVFRRLKWARRSRAERWTGIITSPAAGGRTCRTAERELVRDCCSTTTS